MAARSEYQLSTGPMELAKETQEAAARPKRTQAVSSQSDAAAPRAKETRTAAARPEQTADATVAAELFDAALKAANITNDEAAYLLGVSASLVRRMRSSDARECPSFVQLVKLGPGFMFELHRAMNRRYGFGRALLRNLIDDIGGIALAAEAQ